MHHPGGLLPQRHQTPPAHVPPGAGRHAARGGGMELEWFADSSALNARPNGSWGGLGARFRQVRSMDEPTTALVSW